MENTIPKIKPKEKESITEDELLETLTLISLLSKNLAKKVLLIPEEEEPKEVHTNGNRSPFKEM